MVTDEIHGANELWKLLKKLIADNADDERMVDTIFGAFTAVRKERDAELGKENAGFYSLGASVERENQEDEIAELEAEIKEWSAAARKAALVLNNIRKPTDIDYEEFLECADVARDILNALIEEEDG